MAIYQGNDLCRGWLGADIDYADQTAIFAHSAKGFTANKLVTRLLEDCSHFFEAGTETK